MGFDLGVALGAAANSGLNTYTQLTKIKQEKAKEERDLARFGEEQKAWKAREALQQAAAEVPTSNTVPVQTMVGATGGVDEGLPMVQQAITPEEKAANFRQRALTLGADPTAVQQYEAGGLQIAGAKQNLEKGGYEINSLKDTDQFNKKFRSTMDSLHTDMTNKVDAAHTLAETDGMNGLVKTYGSELKKAYGHDIALVGNNIVVKDAKGKTIQTISNTQDALAALDGHFKTMFGSEMESRMLSQGLFKTPQELHAYLNNKEQTALKGREVAAKEATIESEKAKNFASADYSNSVTRINNMSADNRVEANSVLTKWNNLTPAQQEGPEGMALRQEYAMINAKAGGGLPVSAKGTTKGSVLTQPVEQKQNADGSYTAFAKDGGKALYNTINGEAIPLGMDVTSYQKMKKDATDNGVKLVSGEEDGRLVLRYQGADGKFYTDPSKARYAKPAPAAGALPTEEPKASAIPAPAGSPIAKAQANREANAEKRRLAQQEVNANVQKAIDVSRKTMSDTPQSRFEQDRKTMSKADLRRTYGNGRGLSDEQYTFMTQ